MLRKVHMERTQITSPGLKLRRSFTSKVALVERFSLSRGFWSNAARSRTLSCGGGYTHVSGAEASSTLDGGPGSHPPHPQVDRAESLCRVRLLDKRVGWRSKNLPKCAKEHPRAHGLYRLELPLGSFDEILI